MASEPGPENSYKSHPAALVAEWQKIREQHGDPGVDQFNALLMCHAIAHAVRRMESDPMPDLLKQEYLRNYERILQRAESASGSDMHLSDDIVSKDLGLCTQRLFAAGYAVVETKWSLARRHSMLGGIDQFVRFGGLYYLRFMGRGPFLGAHFHSDWSHLFTPEGRIHMLKAVATIMEWQPDYKALIGNAWYYDPVVAQISPHLAYVRNYLEDNGASFFRSTPDLDGNALLSSKRRQMQERGEYEPRKYLMVWPRRSLLSWFRREAPVRT